jgi:hypothetical protein
MLCARFRSAWSTETKIGLEADERLLLGVEGPLQAAEIEVQPHPRMIEPTGKAQAVLPDETSSVQRGSGRRARTFGEHCYRDRSRQSNAPAMFFDARDLVKCVGREVTLAASGAGEHWDVLDDE